jgi:hypothetical protein
MKKQPSILPTRNKIYRIHQLKTVEPYFSAVKSGVKTFEVRRFDRDFQIGDILDLTFYNPQTKELGERVFKRVTYMLTVKPFVRKGYVILGIVDDEIIL